MITTQIFKINIPKFFKAKDNITQTQQTFQRKIVLNKINFSLLKLVLVKMNLVHTHHKIVNTLKNKNCYSNVKIPIINLNLHFIANVIVVY